MMIKNPPATINIFCIGRNSSQLFIGNYAYCRHLLEMCPGFFKVVWVTPLGDTAKQKEPVYQYRGVPGRITGIDPMLWLWGTNSCFSEYTTKKGRELMFRRTQLQKPAEDKWRHERQITAPFKWSDPWFSKRNQEEGAFMWSVWHHAVATNSWRSRFIPQVSADCPLCGPGFPENYSHCFFFCPNARIGWNFGFQIIHILL